MDASKVISLRITLKCDKNLPLRLFIADGTTVVDESLTTQFTIWADEDEMLYVYRLTGMQEDKYPNNMGKAISLIAIPYQYIQAMEICALPLTDIKTSLEAIEATGHELSSEFKERVERAYNQLLNDDRYVMSHASMNNMTGSMLDTNDAYYGDRFRESFKETLQERTHNINAAKEAAEASGDPLSLYKDGINDKYVKE